MKDLVSLANVMGEEIPLTENIGEMSYESLSNKKLEYKMPVTEVVEKVEVTQCGSRPTPDVVNTVPSFSCSPTSKVRGSLYQNIKMKMANNVTQEVPTEYYGNVSFRGGFRRSMSKFVRLSNNTDPQVAYELMLKQWGLEQPRLLISVTGGAKSFALDAELKQSFAQGLSKVCGTPGCWVITGGTNAGVMKHVGDALQGSNALIGIASWGIVTNRESLKHNEDDTPCEYKSTSWLTEEGSSLDNNHSHFLLVDDGSQNKYGVEIPFRGHLESYIATKGVFAQGMKEGIPSVLLVLEGGSGTLGTVFEYVKGKNPVIVFKSSGRAADALAHALDKWEEILEAESKGETHQGLMEFVKSTFPKEADGKSVAGKCYDKILRCLKFKDYFTVFKLGSKMDVDDAIMEALLTATHRETTQYQKLELSLIWNRVDIARNKILRGITRWEEEKELHWITIMALAMNNVQFMQMLSEYDVDIPSIITPEVLEFLYGYRSFDKTSPLRYLFEKNQHDSLFENSSNSEIFNKLVSYHNDIKKKHILLKRDQIEELVANLCKKLCRTGKERFVENLNTSKTIKDGSVSFMYPYRELLFWAILNNLQQMALFFWHQGDEQLSNSLIGAHMVKELKKLVSNQQILVTDLTETASKFHEASISLLDKCYEEDSRQTGALIISPLSQEKELTILHLALRANNLDVISHIAVQQVMEARWIGALKDSNTRLVSLLMAFLFPPLVLTLKFRTEHELKLVSHAIEHSIEEFHDSSSESSSEEEECSRGERKIKVDKKSPKYNSLHGKDHIDSRLRRRTYEDDGLTKWQKITYFYVRTPIVKFVSHTMAYLIFITFLSYIAMTIPSSPNEGSSIIEWILIVTVFGHLIAEIYQIAMIDAPSTRARLSEWWESFWNRFDVCVLTLYVVSLCLKFQKESASMGHLLYSIDCGCWWLRLLHMLVVDSTLGPYLVMISKMIQDLLKFMFILLIVIIAYGVTSTSILTPYAGKGVEVNRLRDIIWKPYFNIYGELFAESEPENANSTRFGTPSTNSYNETFVWILLGLYLLFTNILLLNLLIAVFNDRYTEVKEKAKENWKFIQASLILEYEARHPLFPPLSLLGHAIRFVCWAKRKVFFKKTDEERQKETENSQKRNVILADLSRFESDCMAKIRKDKTANLSKNMEGIATELMEKIDALEAKIGSKSVVDESCNEQL